MFNFIYCCFIYDRKKCVFYEKLTKFPERNHAEDINIFNEKTMLNCKSYFPRATQLKLSTRFDQNADSLLNILRNLMPLIQLTSLTITYQCNISIKSLVDLLNAMSNIQTLHFNTDPAQTNDHTDIRQSEAFRNLAKNNQISHLIISGDYKLEMIKLFAFLCPQIKHSTIESTYKSECEKIIPYLNSNKQTILSNLCFMHVTSVGLITIDFSKILRKISDLLNNCDHKIIESDLYICF